MSEIYTKDDDTVIKHEDDNAYMLTTTDNPYNPFTHYEDWYAYDEAMGYHTCGLLARYTISSDELSEADQDLAINLAISEIIELNPFGVHKKIYKN